MTTDHLKYDFRGIEGLVADIQLVKNTLTQTHGDLEAYIGNLVATWDGTNREAYQTVQAQWNANHNDLIDTLNAIANAVQNGGQVMEGTEAKLTDGWVSL